MFQHLGLLGETEVMVEGLVLCDEKIAWDQDALCDSCLCPFLSRLGSGHYPFPWPHSHAQLFREHLGHWSRGRWEQDCCVTFGEAARKSSGSWHWLEVLPGSGKRCCSPEPGTDFSDSITGSSQRENLGRDP